MFYGPDPIAPYQRAATFVDKILNGRKPAELAAEQPTKFQFIINLQNHQADRPDDSPVRAVSGG